MDTRTRAQPYNRVAGEVHPRQENVAGNEPRSPERVPCQKSLAGLQERGFRQVPRPITRGDDVDPSVAVVGATGAVGELMRTVLEERNFPLRSIKFLASERSAGKTVTFRGTSYPVEPIRPEAYAGVDIVLSSTPASVSREFSPIA